MGVVIIKVKINIVFEIININYNILYLSVRRTAFYQEEEKGERVSVIRTVHSE